MVIIRQDHVSAFAFNVLLDVFQVDERRMMYPAETGFGYYIFEIDELFTPQLLGFTPEKQRSVTPLSLTIDNLIREKEFNSVVGRDGQLFNFSQRVLAVVEGRLIMMSVVLRKRFLC